MSAGGAQAEDRALQFLLSQGLRLKQRNYHCRMGEIDLILVDGNSLVFVEVRMRSSRAFGGAAESITARKQARIIAAARHYLARQTVTPACRFDAVLIDANDAMQWVKDAFGE
ncbi:MAG: YraN family protein [Betaproteobacteria bacterium]